MTIAHLRAVRIREKMAKVVSVELTLGISDSIREGLRLLTQLRLTLICRHAISTPVIGLPLYQPLRRI
jgi:hypothetical protein